MCKDNQIFVFGSNLQGIHGKGAALEAKQKYGAIQGIGWGIQGRSYAIPTKRTPKERLSLNEIRDYVANFITYAYQNPGMEFYVTRIGCGLAGYQESEIRPLFDDIMIWMGNLPNVEFTWTE